MIKMYKNPKSENPVNPSVTVEVIDVDISLFKIYVIPKTKEINGFVAWDGSLTIDAKHLDEVIQAFQEARRIAMGYITIA